MSLLKEDFIIVIGASAGGMNAIQRLLRHLSPDIDAAVCIVLHLSKKGASQPFIDRLQKSTLMPCHVAADNLPLENGHVYLAAADYHMIIRDSMLLLGRGSAESRWRPSIDVAMRSAATAWDTHCIGIVLSGLLDDGVSGMDAIRRCGGVTIVQEPADAEYPDMPQSVLMSMKTDHCLAVEDMPDVIYTHLSTPVLRVPPPDSIKNEAMLSELVASRIDHMNAPGMTHTFYTCPDCGGGLWELREGHVTRYRCHIGHTFTQNDLLSDQAEKIEGTLWVALRMMEERRHLLLKFAGKEGIKGFDTLADEHQRRAEEIELHIERLKEFLFAFQRDGGS